MKRAVLVAMLVLAGATSVGLAQQLPAPTERRIDLPADYRTAWTHFYTFDRADNRQVRVVYGNDAAAGGQAGQPFAHGSRLLMEVYRAVLGSDGAPVLDADGRFVRDDFVGSFLMGKEMGWGADFAQNRNGEWEYAMFQPDGTPAPVQNTGACALCHTDAGGTRDWTWRTDLFFRGESGALPKAPSGSELTNTGTMKAYVFLPELNTVKAGTTMTWANNDSAVHTVTGNAGMFDSGRMGPGATFSYTFAAPGVYEYSCTIHPVSMNARIVVE